MKAPTGGSRQKSISSLPFSTRPPVSKGANVTVPPSPHHHGAASGFCSVDPHPNRSTASSGSGTSTFLPAVSNDLPTSGANLSLSREGERRLEDEYELGQRPMCTFPNGVMLFTARLRSSDGFRAIKVFDGREMSLEKRQRVRHEAQIGLDLPLHPHLVNTVDFFETPHRLAIVMDMWSGGTLLDYLLCRGPLNEDQSVHILGQLLQALAHLHANGVMHRDVKPENIFLSHPTAEENRRTSTDGREAGTPFSRGTLKNEEMDSTLPKIGLGDLSLSTSKIPNSDYVGSPQYSAPELAMIALRKEFRTLGRPLYNEKCDIWSVGVLTFVLLTRLLPFDGEAVEDIFSSVMGNAIPFDKAPRMSEDAKKFILLLTKTNPGSRPTAKDALRHPWLSGKRNGLLL